MCQSKLLGLTNKRCGPDERLQAANIAAGAARAIDLHSNVTAKNTGKATRPTQHATLQSDTATNARTERQAEQIFRYPTRSIEHFPNGVHACIVLYEDRQAECLGEGL